MRCHYGLYASHRSFRKVFELLNILWRVSENRGSLSQAAARAAPDIEELNLFLYGGDWAFFLKFFHESDFGFRSQVAFSIFDLKAIVSQLLAFSFQTTLFHIDTEKFLVEQLLGDFISVCLSVLLCLSRNDLGVRYLLHRFLRSHFVSLCWLEAI